MKTATKIVLASLLMGTGSLFAMEAPPAAAVAKPKTDCKAKPSSIPVEFVEKLSNAGSLQAYKETVQEIYNLRVEYTSGPLKFIKATLQEFSFILAALYGHTTMLCALIAEKADLRAVGPLALVLASGNGHTDAVQVLLAAGMPVSTEALCAALAKGHRTIALLLIDSNPQLFAEEYKKLTAATDQLTALSPEEKQNVLKGTNLLCDPSQLVMTDGVIYAPSQKFLETKLRSVLLESLHQAWLSADIEKYKKVAESFYMNRSVFSFLDQVIEAKRSNYLLDLLDFSLLLAENYQHAEVKVALLNAGAHKQISELMALKNAIALDNVDAVKHELYQHLRKLDSEHKPRPITTPGLEEFLEKRWNEKYKTAALIIETPSRMPFTRNQILTYALNETIRHDSEAVVRLLLQEDPYYRVDINSKDGLFGELAMTPLAFAEKLLAQKKTGPFIKNFLRQLGAAAQ